MSAVIAAVVSPVRPAINRDAPAVKALVFSVLREYGLTPDPRNTDSDLDDLDAHYFARGGWFGVLVMDSSIVACAGIHRVDGTTCELRNMHCLPAYRGRGFGRQLLDHALAQARALKFKRVVLETASPLAEAIALYRHYGFTPYEPEEMSVRCDQAYEVFL
jgi:putative acetyltransferase